MRLGNVNFKIWVGSVGPLIKGVSKRGMLLMVCLFRGVAVRGIRPYFGCGFKLLQENQYSIRFLYCYVVAE